MPDSTTDQPQTPFSFNEDNTSAHKALENTSNSLVQHVEQLPFEFKSAQIVETLAATVVFLLAIFVLKKALGVLHNRLIQGRETFTRSLSYKSHTFVNAEQIQVLSVRLMNFFRMACYVGLFYVYLLTVFSFFPATKGLADLLVGYILTILGFAWDSFIRYLPKLLAIITISVSAYYLLKFLKSFFSAIEDGKLKFQGFYTEWAKPTYFLIQTLSVILIVILLFPLLPGFDSPAFKGISVFLGVLISLGSSSAVANTVAGIVLIYMRTFDLGDRIETNDVVGDVIEKSLLVTRIRTIKNVEITLPNSTVLGALTKNFSKLAQNPGLILHTTVTIGYDTPWRQVHELLIASVASIPGLLQHPEPFILQKSLDDFYVSYELNVYTDRPNEMANLYSLIHQSIQDHFNQANVEIMSPHYNALRDGNQITVPGLVSQQ